MHMVVHALVLREVDYKETDKILTVLTQENGKMTLAARGCRKRGSALAAACQLMVWSEMTVYEYRGRWGVKEAAPLRQFDGVRGDLDRLALACWLAELTQTLTAEDLPAPEVLSLALNSLHALDRLGLSPEQVKAAFELRLMCLSGYAPMLDGCGVCAAQPEQPRLHLAEGVLHCAGCVPGPGRSAHLTPAVLAAMRHIAGCGPKRLFSFRLDPASMALLGRTCEEYVLTQLERGFGTLDFYNSLHTAPPLPEPQDP